MPNRRRLADADGDGSLNATEFVVAMHLVYNCLSGRELPRQVPEELVLQLPVCWGAQRHVCVCVCVCAYSRARLMPSPKCRCASDPRGAGRRRHHHQPSERSRPTPFVPQQQRVIQAFAAPGAPAVTVDPYAAAPHPSELHHATRDRPTLRCGRTPRAFTLHTVPDAPWATASSCRHACDPRGTRRPPSHTRPAVTDVFADGSTDTSPVAA